MKDMKTSHTPGPWIVKRQHPFTVYSLEIIEMGVGDSIPNIESEANERLIAAAPELLQALIRAKGTMERDKNCGYRLDYNGQPAHEVGSTYVKVCEAIKKATE